MNRHISPHIVALVVCLAVLLPHRSNAQSFTALEHNLPDLAFGSFAFGDADNDGDLDIALVGSAPDLSKTGALHLNDGSGTFQQIASAVPALSPGRVCWADYDRDADLDLLVSGSVGTQQNPVPFTQLLRNDDGVLTDSGIALPTLSANALAFADFDNDGDLDLLISGPSNTIPVTYLLWNQNNHFVESGLNIPGAYRGATIAPADCENDGDLDLLLTPVRFTDPGLAEFGTLVMLNKGDGTFDQRRVTIDGNPGISAAWHDFNLDGRLDIAVAGNGKWTVALYDSTFDYWRGSQIGSVEEAQLAVGDFDRDGRPDLITIGKEVGRFAPTTRFARNVGVRVDGLDVTYPDIGLTAGMFGEVAFADLDADADLDIALMGMGSSGQYTTKAYRNNLVGAFPSAVPSQLSHTLAGSTATLTWQGIAGATTFNVRIGTTPGGVNIVTPMADISTGRRRLPALGNAGQARSFRIKGLPPGRYYWSVQTIDAAFNGSQFAPEQEFTISNTPQLPSLSSRIELAQNRIVLIVTTAGRLVNVQQSTNLFGWQDASSPLTADQEISFSQSESQSFFRLRVLD